MQSLLKPYIQHQIGQFKNNTEFEEGRAKFINRFTNFFSYTDSISNYININKKVNYFANAPLNKYLNQSAT